MKRVVLLLIIFLLLGLQHSRDENDMLATYCFEFKQLYENIATESITPDSASKAFAATFQKIQSLSHLRTNCTADTVQGVFPIQGYRPKESIGGRGLGYRPNNFDLFDMQVKGSHPAHDLFIRDRNMDSKDDRTLQPVAILAFSSGVVVDVQSQWQSESNRRGGNYVWIYDPCLNGLFYYAHASKVHVKIGSWVNRGDKIAEVGRTGLNALRKRSGTHLHFMFLYLDEHNHPIPYNTYDWLVNAEVR